MTPSQGQRTQNLHIPSRHHKLVHPRYFSWNYHRRQHSHPSHTNIPLGLHLTVKTCGVGSFWQDKLGVLGSSISEAGYAQVLQELIAPSALQGRGYTSTTTTTTTITVNTTMIAIDQPFRQSPLLPPPPPLPPPPLPPPPPAQSSTRSNVAYSIICTTC